MNEKIKQAKKLKHLHKEFLNLIENIEAYIPTSSDELYEQVHQLKQYQKSITHIEKELEYLYLDIGSQKIINDFLAFDRKNSKRNPLFDN